MPVDPVLRTREGDTPKPRPENSQPLVFGKYLSTHQAKLFNGYAVISGLHVAGRTSMNLSNHLSEHDMKSVFSFYFNFEIVTTTTGPVFTIRLLM